MPNLFNECDECMNARATEVCPNCGQDLCVLCLEEHDCEDDDYQSNRMDGED